MADDLLGIGEAADSLSQPLQEFLTKLFGSDASEVGKLFTNQVQYFRWKDVLNILEQARCELDERQLTTNSVPLKILLPILEGASLESNDDN